MASLFDAFSLKDVTLRNRIAVAPMCQYSSNDGYLDDWHLVHLGSRAIGGAGLVMVEATAVTPEGRISPHDSGLYYDAHVDALEPIARFLKAHGSVPGIQLAHAGRKASASRPWEGDHHLDNEQGGWETIAPSAVAFGERLTKVPREMTLDDIRHIQNAFCISAQRALDAGFEWLELHFAHGYLAHEFYSPLANHRQDQYGGSFENRIRFMLDTLRAVRKVWPENLPLTARLSVTDWVDGGVTIEESIEVAKRFKAEGLDLLDVSHGFVTPDIASVPWGPGFMAPLAKQIKHAADIPVAVGWLITEPKQADSIIRNDESDLVMLARELLRDPYWPYHAALALKADGADHVLPVQYARAAARR